METGGWSNATENLGSGAVAAIVAATGSVAAHHAFSAEFDANAPVKLQGPITKVELVNPHAWIHIEVKTPDGKTESGRSKAARRIRCSAAASRATRSRSAR